MKKFLLLIHGPMGSGKTTVSNLLHSKLAPVALVGLDRIKWFVSGFKRNKAYNNMTRKVLVAMVSEYLEQDVSVIVEQAFLPEHISLFKKIAKKYKARFFVYQLEAPKHILLERVQERCLLKTGKPKISQARISRNMRLFERIKYNDIPKFDSSAVPVEVIVNDIFKDLKG